MKLCETKGTIEYFIKYRWKDINKRTINGSQSHRIKRKNNASYLKRGIEVRMTKTEFRAFCIQNQDVITGLYAESKIPSIDRIDPSGHYEISNIRILDVSLNRGKSY